MTIAQYLMDQWSLAIFIFLKGTLANNLKENGFFSFHACSNFTNIYVPTSENNQLDGIKYDREKKNMQEL